MNATIDVRGWSEAAGNRQVVERIERLPDGQLVSRRRGGHYMKKANEMRVEAEWPTTRRELAEAALRALPGFGSLPDPGTTVLVRVGGPRHPRAVWVSWPGPGHSSAQREATEDDLVAFALARLAGR